MAWNDLQEGSLFGVKAERHRNPWQQESMVASNKHNGQSRTLRVHILKQKFKLSKPEPSGIVPSAVFSPTVSMFGISMVCVLRPAQRLALCFQITHSYCPTVHAETNSAGSHLDRLDYGFHLLLSMVLLGLIGSIHLISWLDTLFVENDTRLWWIKMGLYCGSNLKYPPSCHDLKTRSWADCSVWEGWVELLGGRTSVKKVGHWRVSLRLYNQSPLPVWPFHPECGYKVTR